MAGSELSGLRVAVTGASGFLGSHIALGLAAAGAEVSGVVRSPGKAAWLEERGVKLLRADLSEPAALERAFAGQHAVVANAALGSNQGSLEELVRSNVSGAENTLRAAAAAGASRVVYISSTGIYRNRSRVWQGEESPRIITQKTADQPHRFSISDLTTDWRYAHSKALAEEAVWGLAAELGLRVTSLRPGPIYGSRDPKLLPRLERRLRWPCLVVPGVGIPLVHAGDIAKAAQAALSREQSVGQAYNLSGPPVSLGELFRLLRDLSGEQAQPLATQAPQRGKMGRPWLLELPLPWWVGYDTRKAERDLGFNPRNLEAGLREALGLTPASAL